MHRDSISQAGSATKRSHPRKEWGRDGADLRERASPEHGRLSSKSHRSDAIRVAEAERQIRELRGRY